MALLQIGKRIMKCPFDSALPVEGEVYGVSDDSYETLIQIPRLTKMDRYSKFLTDDRQI